MTRGGSVHVARYVAGSSVSFFGVARSSNGAVQDNDAINWSSRIDGHSALTRSSPRANAVLRWGSHPAASYHWLNASKLHPALTVRQGTLDSG